MNKTEDIVLGYIKNIKPEKKYKLNPENMPSKIGGKPVIKLFNIIFLIGLACSFLWLTKL